MSRIYQTPSPSALGVIGFAMELDGFRGGQRCCHHDADIVAGDHVSLRGRFPRIPYRLQSRSSFVEL